MVLVLGAAEAGSGCWEAELWTWVCKGGVGETPGAGASGRLDGGCWAFPGRVPAETKLKAATQAAFVPLLHLACLSVGGTELPL